MRWYRLPPVVVRSCWRISASVPVAFIALKKALIIFMALVFVLPIGVGMFGGPPAPVPPAPIQDDAATARRELSNAIHGHCSAKTTQPAQLDACVKAQVDAFNASVRLFREHDAKDNGPAIRSCMAKWAATVSAATDWTKVRECIRRDAGV